MLKVLLVLTIECYNGRRRTSENTKGKGIVT